jgi:hypothetical protein
MSELIYYKTNVRYGIGVRADITDRKGMLLSPRNPYYAISIDKERDFLFANREAIEKGLIERTNEPSYNWDTSNAISDEKAEKMVKSYAALKSELPKLTSVPMLEKLLSIAVEQSRPATTVKLIETRLGELQGTEEEDITDMKGTELTRG